MTEVAFVDESGTTRLRGQLVPPPGGSQPLVRYDVTILASAFPIGGEVLGMGIDLAVGDTLVDLFASDDGTWDGGNSLRFGRAPLDNINQAWNVDTEKPDNHGPYAGDTNSDGITSSAYDGSGFGFLPVIVAHELSVTNPAPATVGTVQVRVFVLKAAAIVALPDVG